MKLTQAALNKIEAFYERARHHNKKCEEFLDYIEFIIGEDVDQFYDSVYGWEELFEDIIKKLDIEVVDD